MESDFIRVLLIESQQLFIDAMTVLFDEEEEIELIGFARKYDEIERLTKEHLPDIVIINMHIPEIQGIQVIGTIKNCSPKTKIIMMGTKPDELLIFNGFQVGADAFLLTDVSNEQLLNTIKEIYYGGHVISGTAAKILVNRIKDINMDSKEYLEKRLKERGIYLTKREMDIAYLLMNEFTNAQISQKLSLEEGTVKNYISEIYSKLNIRKRSQVISFLNTLIKKVI